MIGCMGLISRFSISLKVWAKKLASKVSTKRGDDSYEYKVAYLAIKVSVICLWEKSTGLKEQFRSNGSIER